MNVFITLIIIVYFNSKNNINAFTAELFPSVNYDECKSIEYFSYVTFSCKPCLKEKHLTPTQDRLSCVCNNRSKVINWDGDFPICLPCKSEEVLTIDKRDCIRCPNYTKEEKRTCTGAVCKDKEIRVDFDLSGRKLENVQCIECEPNSKVDVDVDGHNYCKKCENIPNCKCPITTHELLASNICVPRTELSSLPDEQTSTYIVNFDKTDQAIKSHYLKTHLRSSLYQCIKLRKRKACEAVGNMCVMLLYKDENPGGPCRIFREFRYIPTSLSNNNQLIPWLYYGEGDASILINRKKIEAHYNLDNTSPDSLINFVVAKYSVDGKFLGLFPVTGSEFQMCPGELYYMDMAFRFGARYHHSCQLTANEILQKKTEFYDLYLQYYDKSKKMMYAVPLVIRNILHNSAYPNENSDMSQWLLTRRFFLVDNISGVAYTTEKYKIVSDKEVSVVRYLKSATLLIKARREKEEEGKIYPPFLILQYGQLTHSDISSNARVAVSFSVDHYMENDISHIIDVTIGILSAAVLVWSGIETWSHCRRCGRLTIDMSTLMELGLITCGHSSNMLFIVASLVSIHTMIFYKAQSVAYLMLPPVSLENTINKYIVLSFFLKVVEIARLIYGQMKVDIFLIDWERPRNLSNHVVNGSVSDNASSIHSDNNHPVSIWRTYFVANEWNEIQTKRKTSLLFQLLFTLLILKVYGVENWAQADPNFHINAVPYRPESLLLRFAVTLSVYLFVYITQWFLVVGVYERYIKNGIQEFVDVCSMANVSVFILLQQNYGHYIHGRSAHGFSDTDMQTILTQLRREEDDLVGHRGLLPGTDQQTFQIIIPTALRTYYNKVMSPLNLINRKHGSSTILGKAVNNDDASQVVEAYNNMNKFLAAFLDHALKDLDYEVRDKLFVEQLLDIEFWDSLDRGVFYVDNGHSFDGVLFYGNEGTLFSLDLMLFLALDVLCNDLLYSAILTLVIIQILVWFRNVTGRRNLARKTLVDDRFLI